MFTPRESEVAANLSDLKLRSLRRQHAQKEAARRHKQDLLDAKSKRDHRSGLFEGEESTDDLLYSNESSRTESIQDNRREESSATGAFNYNVDDLLFSKNAYKNSWESEDIPLSIFSPLTLLEKAFSPNFYYSNSFNFYSFLTYHIPFLIILSIYTISNNRWPSLMKGIRDKDEYLGSISQRRQERTSSNTGRLKLNEEETLLLKLSGLFEGEESTDDLLYSNESSRTESIRDNRREESSVTGVFNCNIDDFLFSKNAYKNSWESENVPPSVSSPLVSPKKALGPNLYYPNSFNPYPPLTHHTPFSIVPSTYTTNSNRWPSLIKGIKDKDEYSGSISQRRQERTSSNTGRLKLNEEETLLLKLREEENLSWRDTAVRLQTDLGKAYHVPILKMRYKRLREGIKIQTAIDENRDLARIGAEKLVSSRSMDQEDSEPFSKEATSSSKPPIRPLGSSRELENPDRYAHMKLAMWLIADATLQQLYTSATSDLDSIPNGFQEELGSLIRCYSEELRNGALTDAERSIAVHIHSHSDEIVTDVLNSWGLISKRARLTREPSTTKAERDALGQNSSIHDNDAIRENNGIEQLEPPSLKVKPRTRLGLFSNISNDVVLDFLLKTKSSFVLQKKIEQALSHMDLYLESDLDPSGTSGENTLSADNLRSQQTGKEALPASSVARTSNLLSGFPNDGPFSAMEEESQSSNGIGLKANEQSEPLQFPSIVERNSVLSFCSRIHMRMYDYMPALWTPLKEGERRIHWTCPCGAKLYDDFFELKAGALDRLEKELNDEGMSKGDQPGGLLPRLLNGLANLLPVKLSSQGVNEMEDDIAVPNTGLRPTVIDVDSDKDSVQQMFLLLCINDNLQTTRLHQKSLQNLKSDQQLFRTLRHAYSSRIKQRWYSLPFHGLRDIHFTRVCQSDLPSHS